MMTRMMKKKKPKEKDPLDSLPPSKFNMNEFKYMFVNEKDKPVALAKFWEMYDPEGWSLWCLDY